MTLDDRVTAVAKLGFTERQARFLVTVMLHSGVCLARQYCAHAHIVRGQKVHDFFSALTTRKLATRYGSAHGRAYMFHVHAKPLYRAIGEPDNRHRKPVTLARAVERLMVLDEVLSCPELRWLGSERDKREYFEPVCRLRPEELPHLTFGEAPARTVRYFPDKQPIGVSVDGRSHLFLYSVTRRTPREFRQFLHRHAELLRALSAWELRLLIPRHLAGSADRFVASARDELARPLTPETIKALQSHFKQRRQVESGQSPRDLEEFARLEREFSTPRHWALYRTWRDVGEPVLYGTASPVLRDAMARLVGEVTTRVVSHSYHHLTPLVGTA